MRWLRWRRFSRRLRLTSPAPAHAARLYLRIFLRTGPPFGLVMGLVAFVSFGLARGWDEAAGAALYLGLASGVLFGLAMSGLLGTAALVAVRDRGPDALCVHQQRVVRLPGSRQDVAARVAAAVSGLPGAAFRVADAQTGTFEAEVGGSWKSFGEVVAVRLEREADDAWHVHVESRPRIKGTMVDYGVNASNADAVVQALQAGQQPARLPRS